MKSVKIKIGLIAALALAFSISLGAFVNVMVSRADRAVSVEGSNVFSLAGGAEIWAHRVEHKTQGENGEETDDPYYYAMFAFEHDDDAVNYRRNLAYKWFYNVNDADDYLSDPPAEPLFPEKGEGYLSLEIGFEEINFEKFVLTFETQQYAMTEDEKTVNYIIFLPEKNGETDTGKLIAVITGDKDAAEKEAKDIPVPEDPVALDPDHIVIKLSGGESGEYGVGIYNSSNEASVQNGVFGNVGKTFARNVSSSTSPVIPLSFKADMPEKADGDKSEVRARMALYELNGQSFILNRTADGKINENYTPVREVDDGDGKRHYEGGQVNDLTPPVMCLDSGLSYIAEGSELGNFTAIDVLRQSTGEVETGYFILTSAQAADENFNPDDCIAENLFRVVKPADDQYIIPHANHYVPKEENYAAGSFGKEFVPCAAIKIYLKLTDTTATGGQSTYILLDWYVDEQYKLTVNGKNYIAVATDATGASYNYGYEGEYVHTEEDGSKKPLNGWAALLQEYQDKVDEAAKELRAGSDDFYLPSFEKLVKDNATAYSDMTYSVYYMANGERLSSTGKSASNLSLELNKDGDYKFTVYAQDSASNPMWYTKEVEGGDPETVEFAASEIWDIYDDEDLRDKLPWFTFTAGISEISVEEPEEQDTAYVGSTFTAGTFEIKGISINDTYSLYRFNNEIYAAEHDGQVLSYERFMESKKELFDGEGRKYFTNIVAESSLEEGSEEYEQFGKYKWTPSSRSFVPQDGNNFYLIVCEVTSSQFPTIEPVKAYMGIAASVTPKPIEGENTWLKDNMISIILLSIAAAAFIGIILLLVIKPKQKEDIDVRFEEENAAKTSKPAKDRKTKK